MISLEEDILEGTSTLFSEGMLGISGNERNSDSSNEGIHPLMQRLVLKSVFEYLEDDAPALLNCRKVCKTWRNVIDDQDSKLTVYVDSDGEIDSFMEIMSNPSAQLPSRRLFLKEFDEMQKEDIVSLMETWGPSFKKLVLYQVDLQYFTFLFMPTWFPNLVSITIDINSLFDIDLQKSIKIPSLLRTYWETPFPCLKRLEFIRSVDSVFYYSATTNFLMFLLNKMPPLEELMLTVVPPVFDQLVPRFAAQPEIFAKVETLRFSVVSAKQLDILKGIPMRLKYVWVSSTGPNYSSKAFGGFLQASKDSLRQLWVEGFEATRDLMGADNHLLIPCKMENLEMLHITDFKTIGGPKVEETVLNQLPKLRIAIIGASSGDKSDGKLFWESFFPKRNPLDGIKSVYANLKMLRVDWFLEDPRIVNEIKECLTGLSELHLAINGNLLAVLVDVMKDSKIEQLGVTYFETEEKMIAFDAGLTGMSERNCERLLHRDEFANVDVNKDKLKVRPSLADWKHLNRLELAYSTGKCVFHRMLGGSELDGVAITHCLLLLKNLQRLTLIGFKIEVSNFKKLLEKESLKNLGPGSVVLVDCDIAISKPGGRNNDNKNRNFPTNQTKNRRGRNRNNKRRS